MLVCIAVFRFTCCKAKENPRYTGMPDPEFVRRQKTVEKVNMVYGTDKCPITLYRPVDAYFTVAPGTALNARDKVWLRADDSSWSAEVFGVVCVENRVQSEAFAEYYYKGELSNSGEKLEYYRQEVTDLGVTYMNKPVKRIKSTYKKQMKRRPTRHVLSDLNLTIQATVSLPAEVSWDLRYTVSKKKYLSVTSKKYFASCSIPKDNL